MYFFEGLNNAEKKDEARRKPLKEDLGDGENEVFTRQELIDGEEFDYEALDAALGTDGWTAIVDLDDNDGAVEVLNGEKSLGRYEIVGGRAYPCDDSTKEPQEGTFYVGAAKVTKEELLQWLEHNPDAKLTPEGFVIGTIKLPILQTTYDLLCEDDRFKQYIQ